jgi:hypothetical protein
MYSNKRRITSFSLVASLLISLLSLFVFEAGTAFPQSTTDEQRIVEAVYAAIDQRSEALLPGNLWVNPEPRISGTWSLVDIVAFKGMPLASESDQSLLALARQQSGEWFIAFQGSDQFAVWLEEVPNDLISLSARQILADVNPLFQSHSGTSPTQVPTLNFLGFPFAVGETWSFSGGPHGTNLSAVDFARGNGTIRAAAEGVVTRPCANKVKVIHPSGWVIGYYHVRNIAVQAGQIVARGTVLGTASTESGCGGYATGSHVHFWINYGNSDRSMNRQFIGGYRVEAGSSEYLGCLVRNSTRICQPGGGLYRPVTNDNLIGNGIVDTTPIYTVSAGSSWDLDRYRSPYGAMFPEGKNIDDIVGMGVAGANDHVYVWYRDGTVSSGTSRDLNAYRQPYTYSLAPGKTPADIVGMGIAGSNDRVYVWYRDGTVSSGTSYDLDLYRRPYTYSLAPGKTPADIVGMGIAGSNDYVYVWYRSLLSSPSAGATWISQRFYLNQRALSSQQTVSTQQVLDTETGEAMSSMASIAMVRAAAGLIGNETESLVAEAWRVWDTGLRAPEPVDVSNYLRANGMQTEVVSTQDKDSHWSRIKAEIDADYPVILNSQPDSAGSGLTSYGHYIVVVGYREAADPTERQLLVYDPYGQWTGITNLYDRNTEDHNNPEDLKGRFQLYTFSELGTIYSVVARPVTNVLAEVPSMQEPDELFYRASEDIVIYEGDHQVSTGGTMVYLPLVIR